MTSGARTGLIIAVIAVVVVIAAFALGLIDVDQTKEAALPDVEVSGGQAPGFDVDTADVVVGTTETTVDVPTVDVGSTEKTVDVPVVAVDNADTKD